MYSWYSTSTSTQAMTLGLTLDFTLQYDCIGLMPELTRSALLTQLPKLLLFGFILASCKEVQLISKIWLRKNYSHTDLDVAEQIGH